MPSLKQVKKRIASVKNTQQITKAMYMVSAAKLRRAEENIKQALPYSEKIKKVIASMYYRIRDEEHPLLVRREPVKNVLIVGISSDRGLCGSFNANIIRNLNKFIDENDYNIKAIGIGRKIIEFLKKKSIEIVKNYEGVLYLNYQNMAEAAEIACKLYEEAQIDAIYLCYNHFISAISQKLQIDKILPRDFSEFEEEYVVEYEYEPSKEVLLNAIIPKYVANEFYTALLDSIASEHAARMTSMDNATKNASEMIDKLTLLYNKVRQATITKELMEIVSGKEALES